MNCEHYGSIKAAANCYVIGCGVPCIRLMVKTTNEEDFVYLYISPSNYVFCQDDPVSWGENELFWHHDDKCVRFDLYMDAVKIQ